MKSTDIMIGDWIRNTKENVIGNVHEITSDVIEIYVETPEKEFWVSGEPEKFEGILLTEEILTLNGWRDCDGYMVHKEVPGVELLRRNQGWLWCDGYGGGEYVVTNINCVHELQHVLRILGCDELDDDFEIE